MIDNRNAYWLECAQPADGSHLPQWARRSAILENRVFLPAGVWGSEESMVWAAASDGISAMANANHVYLPSDWLARRYPRFSREIHFIACEARRAVRGVKEIA